MKSVDLWVDNNNVVVTLNDKNTLTTPYKEKTVETDGKPKACPLRVNEGNYNGIFHSQEGKVNAVLEMPVRDSSFHRMDLQYPNNQQSNSTKKKRYAIDLRNSRISKTSQTA
ncbi:hypothetical protein BIW11_01346 [Tropilaelaps mercedesae]|uniref:Uncharacterized protein n=1 Tax=Tropilaelaps mercedesae TaxID=418985 RepID=A0A1V9XF70_9ACAR|nr:hypothetical protein BIW11_01346 [Tropilaelaps mercedesae]